VTERLTAEQFVMWMLGFSETVRGRPTRAQWAALVSRHQQVVARQMHERLTGTDLMREFMDTAPKVAPKIAPYPMPNVTTGTRIIPTTTTTTTSAASGYIAVDSDKMMRNAA